MAFLGWGIKMVKNKHPTKWKNKWIIEAFRNRRGYNMKYRIFWHLVIRHLPKTWSVLTVLLYASIVFFKLIDNIGHECVKRRLILSPKIRNFFFSLSCKNIYDYVKHLILFYFFLNYEQKCQVQYEND